MICMVYVSNEFSQRQQGHSKNTGNDNSELCIVVISIPMKGKKSTNLSSINTMFLCNTQTILSIGVCQCCQFASCICVKCVENLSTLIAQDQTIQCYTCNPIRYVGFIKKCSLPPLCERTSVCILYELHSSNKQFRKCFLSTCHCQKCTFIYGIYQPRNPIYFICTLYYPSPFISPIAWQRNLD